MKLKRNQWYLISSKYIEERTGKRIVAARLIGGESIFTSWELSIPIEHPTRHNGEVIVNRRIYKGRIGYCVYTQPERVIRKLTKMEAFLESL